MVINVTDDMELVLTYMYIQRYACSLTGAIVNDFYNGVTVAVSCLRQSRRSVDLAVADTFNNFWKDG